MKKVVILIAFIMASIMPCVSYAQPYGTGIYNETVPYGSQTSLSIATNGDINIPITPTNDGAQSTGTSTINITSTDVEGYKLYIRALNNTYMDNMGAQLPASANGIPASLATNTWGYNTDASNNFVGITLNDVLIRSTTVPASSGDITIVTFGIKLDLAKPAGNYIANVVYTAVPQTN